MRLHCEYKNCPCPGHVGPADSQCGICTHGSVWHKYDGVSQFQSMRRNARSPWYSNSSTDPQIAKEVHYFLPVNPNEPMPMFAECFCESTIQIPV